VPSYAPDDRLPLRDCVNPISKLPLNFRKIATNLDIIRCSND
jgi:hypothetical protein